MRQCILILLAMSFCLGETDSLRETDSQNYIYFDSRFNQNVYQILLGTLRGATLVGAFATLIDYNSDQQGDYGPPAVVGGGIFGALAGGLISTALTLPNSSSSDSRSPLRIERNNIGYSWIYAPWDLNDNRGAAQFFVKYRLYGKSPLWFNEFLIGISFGSLRSLEYDRDSGGYYSDTDDRYMLGVRRIFRENSIAEPFAGFELGYSRIGLRDDYDTRDIKGPFVGLLGGLRINLFDLIHPDLCFSYEYSPVFNELREYRDYASSINSVISVSFAAYIF